MLKNKHGIPSQPKAWDIVAVDGMCMNMANAGILHLFDMSVMHNLERMRVHMMQHSFECWRH